MSERTKPVPVFGERRRSVAAARATLVLSLLVSSVAGAQSNASSPQVEAARLFEEALADHDGGAFESAIRKLRAAHDIAPHPRVLYNLALCLADAGRPAQAVAAFEQYLAAAGEEMDASRDRVVRARISELKAKAAILELDVRPLDAVITVDGETLGQSRALLLDPGEHELVARAPGFVSQSLSVSARSGEAMRVVVRLLPEAPRRATLIASCAVPDVEVNAGGQRLLLGTREGSLQVAAATHVITFVRDGYTFEPLTRTLDANDPTRVECSVPRRVAPAAASAQFVVPSPHPEQPKPVVDGLPYAGEALPAGAHWIAWQQGVYRSPPALVRLAPNERRALRPVEVFRPDESRTRLGMDSSRTWSLALVSVGAALAAGATVTHFLNAGREEDWARRHRELDSLSPAAREEDSYWQARADNAARARSIRHAEGLELGLWIGAAAFAATGVSVWLIGEPGARRSTAGLAYERRW